MLNKIFKKKSLEETVLMADGIVKFSIFMFGLLLGAAIGYIWGSGMQQLINWLTK
jgi:hypothetical protein